MKHFPRSLLTRVFIIFSILVNSAFAQDIAKTLTIIHTNDLQSRLLGSGPNCEYTPLTLNDDQTVGGIGNHEFDFRPLGLAQIIKAAVARGDIPTLLCANAVFNEVDTRDDSLQALFERGVVNPYQIFVKNGLRIGVFGLLGSRAAEVAPFAEPVTFTDPLAAARSIVKRLKDDEHVDVIICASHGGVHWNAAKSTWEGEDVKLAAEVPEIDVVIGGHSHTWLKTPIVVNNTPVLQAGAEGRYVGVLSLSVKNGSTTMTDYRIIAINDSVEADREIQTMVEKYEDVINQNILRPYGFRCDQTLAETNFSLTIREDNANLGNLVSDAMRWSIDRYEYDPKFPHTRTVLAVESNGLIRDDLKRGKSGLLQVSDLFRVVPLGIGVVDEAPGFALMSVYLTAAEIKKALEVVTTVYPLKGLDFFLQISGAKFRYNANRAPFDRVVDIELADQRGQFTPLDLSADDRQLYKVGCNIFVGTFIKFVGDFTWGLLTIVPKDSLGNPIADLNTALMDADPYEPGIQEVKQWAAFKERRSA